MTLRLPTRKQHKYRAKPCVIEGVKFHSQKEGARWLELRMLEKAGDIYALSLQPLFPLVAIAECDGARNLVGCYKGDFSYCLKGSAALVVEDVKGYDTPLSRWKRKHVQAQYGITVKLV